ncbi:ATP-binding protein [Actinokineospora globicatena]|uniref:ATP-binding protein n=1 Tax=Actinokineospora globicatena TaxID=103729 RepID=UPI0020A5B237|nr:ATP-binding protein [Actinokineospora globicatena]MCP2304505.1 Signal transduction histidine kinase [Actinokineospora globicatena]GLW78127.1 sensor histidine kinase [Actinokineospora globicatena]GLW85207.1 sensor histidine kinase [Actinokineospora globicatena]
MSAVELLTLSLSGEQGVFLLRQRGREVARAIGLETQDQIRIATALSDLGRLLLVGQIPLTVVFELTEDPVASLVVRLGTGLSSAPVSEPGWSTAERLLDEVKVENRRGMVHVRVRKALPGGTTFPDVRGAAHLRGELGSLQPGNAADELRAQNEELLQTLDSLERKQEELLQLNAELEETNRGVVALYAELTEELDDTNRGVVALYAELDEKSNELKRASDAKNRFWSNVSHEVRTPVNSIVGLARLLLGPGADPLTDDQRRQLELISTSGGGLLTLVNDLLDVAKAESGRLQPRVSEVDMRLLFAHLRDGFAPAARDGAVQLVFDELPDAPALRTDDTMLQHILRNLVSNGLKFTERGEVRVSATTDGEHWVFTVADTGIGIPADHLDKVFEEFHQVPNALQARAAGTGLGLPYARSVAEVLGGSLDLRSTPGQGTLVTVRLPVFAAEAPTRPRSVLLVTADDTLRARLSTAMGPLVDAIRQTADGLGAVLMATAERPDLLVLDLAAPHAEDCLAGLHREPRLAGVPVLAVQSAEHRDREGGLVVLHTSQLTSDSVRDGVRRALAAAPEESRP